jgi:nitroreductase
MIAKSRHAERDFSSEQVPASTMQRIVEIAHTAPTSFNLQPYKIIIAQSAHCKELVATAMNPGNDRHVRNAAYTVVFAADTGKQATTR